MPKKRQNASSGGSDDEEYRKKRDRNNQVSDLITNSSEFHLMSNCFSFFCLHTKAVKRSRVKSKQRASETRHRVDELKVKNQVLEENIKKHQKDLKFLKDLFLAQAQAKGDHLKGLDLKELLKDDDDDDNSKSKSSTSKG